MFIYYKGLLLLFFDERDDLANKNEEFYIPTISNVLATISGIPHQFFPAIIQVRDI